MRVLLLVLTCYFSLNADMTDAKSKHHSLLSTKESDQDPDFLSEEWRDFAMKRIPELRFDRESDGYCYPDEAKVDNVGTCKDFNPDAPIYYNYSKCGDFLKLIWYFWYGQRKSCLPAVGPTNNDWEKITINFVGNGSEHWVQDSVTWFQKNGWYTRAYKEMNPIIYVGKTSHGNFDLRCDSQGLLWEQDYCGGGCLYWDDFRNDNEKTRWKPINIMHISKVNRNVTNPISQDKYFLNPEVNSCKGSKRRCLVSPCGCWRGDHTFPANKCDF